MADGLDAACQRVPVCVRIFAVIRRHRRVIGSIDSKCVCQFAHAVIVVDRRIEGVVHILRPGGALHNSPDLVFVDPRVLACRIPHHDLLQRDSAERILAVRPLLRNRQRRIRGEVGAAAIRQLAQGLHAIIVFLPDGTARHLRIFLARERYVLIAVDIEVVESSRIVILRLDLLRRMQRSVVPRPRRGVLRILGVQLEHVVLAGRAETSRAGALLSIRIRVQDPHHLVIVRCAQRHIAFQHGKLPAHFGLDVFELLAVASSADAAEDAAHIIAVARRFQFLQDLAQHNSAPRPVIIGQGVRFDGLGLVILTQRLIDLLPEFMLHTAEVKGIVQSRHFLRPHGVRVDRILHQTVRHRPDVSPAEGGGISLSDMSPGILGALNGQIDIGLQVIRAFQILLVALDRPVYCSHFHLGKFPHEGTCVNVSIGLILIRKPCKILFGIIRSCHSSLLLL